MKVWECICKKDTKWRIATHTKEGVEIWLYENRIIPCSVETDLFNKKESEALTICNCETYQGDCLKCLDNYLELSFDENYN